MPNAKLIATEVADDLTTFEIDADTKLSPLQLDKIVSSWCVTLHFGEKAVMRLLSTRRMDFVKIQFGRG